MKKSTEPSNHLTTAQNTRAADTFVESNLRFVFNTQWKVRKYDAHPFYQAMSGVGMRAVDFVGINEHGSLFLLEVKNYRNRPERELERTLAKISAPQPPLADALFQKIKETKAGIRVIGTYLNRKWWYRMLFFVLNRARFQAFLLRKDRLFWMQANRILNTKAESVRCILHLELPDVLEDQRQIIATYLNGMAESKIEIYSSQQFDVDIIQAVDEI
ncbi:MAG: hypothetical protein AAF847_19360 [Bacteroidota bacterium]